jgi:hypothetical protein
VEDYAENAAISNRATASEDPTSQFLLLEEEMALAREILRSPPISFDEAERSQDFSLAEDTRLSARRDDHGSVLVNLENRERSVSAEEQGSQSRAGGQVLPKRKHRGEFGDKVEGGASKRLHVEEGNNVIHRRTLELAQVFAPSEFEFPRELLTSPPVTVPAPYTGNLDVIEVVGESEADSIPMGDPRVISS